MRTPIPSGWAEQSCQTVGSQYGPWVLKRQQLLEDEGVGFIEHSLVTHQRCE